MAKVSMLRFVSVSLFLSLASGLIAGAFAQESTKAGELLKSPDATRNGTPIGPSTFFTPGNLVVSVEGCGVDAGTCTSVPNGTGGTVGTSSPGGYGDNQAGPLTLFQFAPNGATSASFVDSLVLPQTGSGANSMVSGEYGSSSEATVQLSGNGLYLTVMGYGVNANTFNANPATYGVPAGALAQSGSLTGQSYSPIPRVVALVDPYGNVNSSTLLYNIFNTNNPRSAYTATGTGPVYVSGQGTGCDLTGGVFLSTIGLTNNSPVAITGADAAPTATCIASGYTGSLVAQDTRAIQAFNGTLYVSIDSTEGKNDNRSLIGTLGTPPATSLYTPTNPPTGDTGGPNLLNGFGNTGGTGKETLTAATANGINSSGLQVNISPENFFFASPSVLYVADSGSPKQTSANSNLGAGGLQKWINSKADGSGTWSWEYTLFKGLNLVANSTAKPSNTAGTTGLIGLAGQVVNGVANLYATNYTIGDLDQTFLYGIADALTATSNTSSFTVLATAPSDSDFKGVSIAPTLAPGSATITSSPSGLAVTTSGTGCAASTYITPETLIWTAGSGCTLTVVSPQTVAGTQYIFNNWQDGNTSTSDAVTAPSTAAVYSASFLGVPTVQWPTATGIAYGQTLASSTLNGGSASVPGSFAFTSPGTHPQAGTAPQSVTFTPSNPSQYEAVTGTVSVAVAKAPLTVTANNATKTAGTPNPAFTASYSGFVNGDTSVGVSGSPSLTTTATTSSPAGTYPITPALGTFSAANYTFSMFVNGTLSVVSGAPAAILTTTATVTGSAGAGYTATITVANTGSGPAFGVTLSTATLAGVAATSGVPKSLGTIAAGGFTTDTITFSGAGTTDGEHTSESYAGTYTGGSFSAGLRVTLP